MLDWIFEGIVTWISSVMTSLMDAVSGLFLDALGTDMVVMEDVNAILIQKDRDLVTLLTCHPYGSGGLYRYLVFCERVKEAAPANTGAESLQ